MQRQAGTKRIGAAAKQAPKKVARPLQNAFQSSKAKAKQPAKKGGGLFNFGNAPSPKQVQCLGVYCIMQPIKSGGQQCLSKTSHFCNLALADSLHRFLNEGMSLLV